jgi:3',5'-cyclic AMP phosphodiesterase CpdA
LKIFHISDLHFQTGGPDLLWLRHGWRRAIAHGRHLLGGRRRLFLEVEDVVRRLLAEAERLGASHLVVSGDLTTLALPEEFEAARAALAGWADRMTIIPGNHDRYTPESGRDRVFERAFGQALRSDLPDLCAEGEYPLVKLVGDEVALVGLCSARVTPLPGIAAGWVGALQRRALEAILRDPRLDGRAKLVVVHHGPFRPNGRPDRPQHGLFDAEALLDVAARADVTALLHGHIHHRYRVAGPGGLSIFCAGSSTEKGGRGYWLYDVDRAGLHAADAISLA